MSLLGARIPSCSIWAMHLTVMAGMTFGRMTYGVHSKHCTGRLALGLEQQHWVSGQTRGVFSCQRFSSEQLHLYPATLDALFQARPC